MTLTANLMPRMILVTVTLVVARRPRLVIMGGIRPVVGEMPVGHHLHRPVPVGTRRVAGAMTAEHPRRLTLVGTITIDKTTAAAVMVEIVVSPPRGIVGAATRFRGLHLVGATSVAVRVRVHVHPRVRRHVERAYETGTVLVITTAEEMIHETNTGIAGADAGCLLFCARTMSSRL